MGSVPWPTRRLDRNHACQRPSHFVFVDTETKWDKPEALGGRTRHALRLGCAVAVDWPKGRAPAEEWLDFTDSDEFWKWLRGKQHEKRSLWVVGHNMVFDFTILRGWSRLETCDYRVRTEGEDYYDPRTGRQRTSREWQGLCAFDGFPFHIETQGDLGRVNFTDLMNYYKCSLAEVGKTVGLDKLSKPLSQSPESDWLTYCRRDVEILKTAYLSLVDQWQREDNGNWSLSGPALAWNNYRHRHMSVPVVLHEHAEARDLEWKAYFPGECRAWFRGDCPGPVVHYDVNSLYPAMMATHEFPVELIDYMLTPKPGMVDWLLSKHLCIAEVDLVTTQDRFPFRSSGRVLYPVGTFSTALAGPELVGAWSAGFVRAVRRLAYYRGARLFDSFVPCWWQRKRAARDCGDTAGERLSKLILNGLVGKFCQRNPAWRFDARIRVVRPWRAFPWQDPDTGVVHNARGFGWLGQYAGHRTDSAHCFPAVGAFLTAYAREFMRKARESIPPSMLYYQDTDSLMVAADEIDVWCGLRGDFGDGLGQFRAVGRYEKVTIRGPKNYTCDGRHTIAGVRVNDEPCGPMMWTGTRWEGGPQLVTREPDGTVQTWQRDFETPGTCLEGGYKSDGWYFPIEIH